MMVIVSLPARVELCLIHVVRFLLTWQCFNLSHKLLLSLYLHNYLAMQVFNVEVFSGHNMSTHELIDATLTIC